MSHTDSTSGLPQLRRFGLLIALAIVIFFGLLLPWLWHRAPSIWIWIVATIMAFMGLVVPSLLRPVFKIWMKLGSILGRVNGIIILSIVYYLLVLPMGLVVRLLSKNPLIRKFDRHSATYRIHSHAAPRKQLERPF